jgi:hypothetical protein
MLRTIRLRLRPLPRGTVPSSHPLASRMTSTSTSTATALRSESESESPLEPEPFGVEYGAGPSRLPYTQPLASASDPISSSRRTLVSRNTRDAAKDLRQSLMTLPNGAFATPQQLSRKLGSAELCDMSRLEIHALLHHLVRTKRNVLAAGIMSSSIDEGLSRTPKKRQRFSQRTVAALFKGIRSHTPASRPPLSISFNSHPIPMSEAQSQVPARAATLQPTPRTPTKKLELLLDLHRSLQNSRHRRPPEVYETLIRVCCDERLYDTAAKIYVGLVEEWVTEGRLAEGADLDDFYEGGGPPREWRPEIAPQLKAWWKGVRTWRLPGEVISPHDRLDLWHPQNLSLGEKMRSFPFPLATSPPSAVPEPAERLLEKILATLRLDPAVADPRDFAASMRALAILANTVHSRTLPVLSLRQLLRAFKDTVSSPPVYPSGALPDSIPPNQAWAYQAYTHIHLALQSLLFSPPISSSSLQMAQRHAHLRSLANPTTSTATMTQIARPARQRLTYATPPLNWGACIMLVHYAFDKLGSARMLAKMIKYMKGAFDMGKGLPTLWNKIYRGASIVMDNKLAQQAEDVLFDKTALAREAHVGSAGSVAIANAAGAGTALTGPSTRSVNDSAMLLPKPQIRPQPDETSLLSLIQHLAATSQFDRLESVAYKIIPFLSHSASTSSRPATARNTEAAATGPSRPTHLSPSMYATLLASLEKGGKTGLAQRIYRLALQAESHWAAEHASQHPNKVVPVPQSLRLPIGVFTSMLLVWDNEIKAADLISDSDPQSPPMGRDPPRSWQIPSGKKGMAPAKAAAAMAMEVYEDARSRWQSASMEGVAGIQIPDERFFDAAIRVLAKRWGLSIPRPLWRTHRDELTEVLLDLEDFGIVVPKKLRGKLAGEGGATALEPHEYRVYRSKKRDIEFAAVLAEWQLGALAGASSEKEREVEWDTGPGVKGVESDAAQKKGKVRVEVVQRLEVAVQGVSEGAGEERREESYWEEREEVRAYANL